MTNERAQATREELTARCGHECLRQPDHDELHFYGYRLGPHSYEGLLAELRELRQRLLWIALDNSPEDAQGSAERWAEEEFGPDYWKLDPNAVK